MCLSLNHTKQQKRNKMKATDLKVGSVIEGSFLKSSNNLGLVVYCDEKQVVIEQKHDTSKVVSDLASGRVLKLKQSKIRVSRKSLQKVFDGKNKNCSGKIISI